VADQQRRRGRGALRPRSGAVLWCLVSLTMLALAGCGRSMPPPPAASGGAYTSTTYHFRFSYPSGWEVSTPQQTGWDGNTPTSATPSASVPLEIVATRIDAQAAGGGQVSSFTVIAFDVRDATVASNMKQLEKQFTARGSKYIPTTISGIKGYQLNESPTTIPGSQVTDTHCDYYIITTAFEYQISTDALSDDNATSALQGMLTSFTVLK
jgi:hypothetical protein